MKNQISKSYRSIEINKRLISILHSEGKTRIAIAILKFMLIKKRVVNITTLFLININIRIVIAILVLPYEWSIEINLLLISILL